MDLAGGFPPFPSFYYPVYWHLLSSHVPWKRVVPVCARRVFVFSFRCVVPFFPFSFFLFFFFREEIHGDEKGERINFVLRISIGVRVLPNSAKGKRRGGNQNCQRKFHSIFLL